MPQPPHPHPRLLVADQVAGRVSLLDLPGGEEVAALDHRHPAEHAGFLALPDDLVACVDDRAGELLVLDPYGPDAGRPLVRRRIPVAVPAEHLAAAPDGRRLAVTTGLGRNEEAWTGLLTAVDLDAPDGAVAVRVRGRTGEPGVTVLGGPSPLVVLRHREPGELLVHRHRDLMAAPLPARRRSLSGASDCRTRTGTGTPTTRSPGWCSRRRARACTGCGTRASGSRRSRPCPGAPTGGPVGGATTCGSIPYGARSGPACAAGPPRRGSGRSGPTTPGGTGSTPASRDGWSWGPGWCSGSR